MPFANFKVPAGTITAEDKKKIIERTTDLYAESTVSAPGRPPSCSSTRLSTAAGAWGATC